MEALAGEVWLILAVLAAASIMGLLTAISACIRDETKLHDLRVEVNKMRNIYLRTVLDSDSYSADPVANLRLRGGEDDIIEVGSE